MSQAGSIGGNTTFPVKVPSGGTGNISLTLHGVLIGEGTAPINVTSAGTAGQVLTSNGAGADPTFQNTSATLIGVTNTLTPFTTALGYQAAPVTTGTYNTALGWEALQIDTTGNFNTAVGAATLAANITGSNNTAVGTATLLKATGSYSTAVGTQAAGNTTTGQNETIVGTFALFSNTTGNDNTAVGSAALNLCNSSDNTAIGNHALDGVLTGGQNTALGGSAGADYAAAETGNICIGFNQLGIVGDNYTTRIGATGVMSKCFIDGINGKTPGTTAKITIIDTLGQCGTLASGSAGQVLQSAGASANPAFSTATYPSTTTANQILYSSATNTVGQITTGNDGVLITNHTGVPSLLANSATPGYVLTANTNLPPSWQAPTSAGVITLAGNSGTATGSTITLDTSTNCGATVITSAAGSTVTFKNTDLVKQNMFMGHNAGGTTAAGSDNTGIGMDVLRSVTTASQNTALGEFSLGNLTTGVGNVSIGLDTLYALDSGSRNIAIGNFAGQNYTTSESNNILLSNDGIVGDNHTIRIGTQGSGNYQQNACYIAGIAASTTTNSKFVTIDTTSGHLGATSVTPSGIVSLDGDTSFATGTTVTLTTATNCGSSVAITGNGTTTMTFSNTDALNNVIMGAGAGNATLTGQLNTAVGHLAMAATTSASGCSSLGVSTLQRVTSGGFNNAFGELALSDLTTGTDNNAIGVNCLVNLATGSGNLAIGSSAGSNYVSSESDNILLANPGVVSESHVVRIGVQGSSTGQQNSCYIAGIYGVTIPSGAQVYAGSDGHLGTVYSSRRFKDNIEDIGSKSINIYDLRPVTFKYKNDKSNELHYGLIAEEVEKVLPELVIHGRADGLPESIEYHELPVLLLNEIQNLKKKLDILKTMFFSQEG